MAGHGVSCLRGRPSADTAVDLEDMLEHGFEYHDILRAFGISHEGILKALRRVGRPDLAQRMTQMKVEDTERLQAALGLQRVA